MLRKFGSHLRDQWMGATALFLVLGGGTAWAVDGPLAGQNTVGSEDIIGNEVKSADIADGKVFNVDLADNLITGAKMKDNTLTGADIDESTLALSADCNQGLAANDVMIRVGSVCIDKYEASIWDAPSGGTQITGPIPCSPNGQDCTNIYARSVAGVTPRGDITWFQAAQALANSGKRLPSNAEWQTAVAGTPNPPFDPAGTPESDACNINSPSVQSTGAKAGCISNYGANDMVGNLSEWVGDWDELATSCDSWPLIDYGSDVACIGREESTNNISIPAALNRGGNFFFSDAADGPFAVDASSRPSDQGVGTGFRGAR